MDSIRLLIVHSHPFIVEGIRGFASRLADWHVVAETTSARAAYRVVLEGSVDVVLVEQTLPGVSGIALAGMLRRAKQRLSIGIIGKLDPMERCIAIAHGVGVFIDEHISNRDLHMLALRLRHHTPHRQNFYHPHELYQEAVRTGETILHTPNERSGMPLSQREAHVLALVCVGRTNAEIAQALGISAHTVKQHIARMLAKCQLQDRHALAAYASRMGWVATKSATPDGAAL